MYVDVLFIILMHLSPIYLLLCPSYFLYPSKNWKAGGGDGHGDVLASSGDGKYELLSVANNLIAEEIRNVMSKSECFLVISAIFAGKFEVTAVCSSVVHHC